MVFSQTAPPPSTIDQSCNDHDADSVARRTADLGLAIGKRLRRAQKDAGLTVRDLAEKAHVTPPTIMKIRNGGGGGMAVGLLVDVAKALNVAPHWLLLGHDCGEGPA